MSARVFLLSRAWIFLCAVYAYLTFQPNRAPASGVYDRPELTQPFGGFGDLLLSVWARWDSVWYLGIANFGYGADRYDFSPAFFPLYPLLSRGLAEVGGLFSPGPAAVLAASLAVSLAALAGALYLLYRLVELELDAGTAAVAVALVAFYPMAFFFQAVYSESLFLLASVGAVWFARTGRWPLAGAFGAAAAATRSAGVLVLVPLLLLYTYPPRRDFLWLGLVPLGLAAYMGYLWAAAGDPFRFSGAQDFWLRELGRIGEVPAGPLGGLWQGTSAAFQGVRQLLSGSGETVYWTSAAGDPLRNAALNIEMFAFLVFGLVATVGALRRLPLAYGAYAAAALALPLAYPVRTLPLFSLPRFLAVVFPLFIWLALVVRERGWEQRAIAVSAVALGLFTAQWATWQWVS